MEGEKKRARKVNFSTDEWNVLFEEYTFHRELLQAAHTNAITNKRKNETWKGICERVNALGVAERSVDDLKAKITNMKSNVRAKHRHQQQTGGGPPAPAIPHEQIVEELFGKDSVDLHGIPGKKKVLYYYE